MPDRRSVFPCALLALALSVLAGADETPGARSTDGVPIMFLPPPMEGTLSVGIYDAAGKLVRVLHREAGIQDFKVAENGLLTHWDGRDASGQRAAPGKYKVAGLMVGELGVEGVAFHGNDWIKDDSPRYSRVTAVKNVGRDEVHVILRTVEGNDETLAWKLGRDGVEPPKSTVEARIEDGRLMIRSSGTDRPVELGAGDRVIESVVGHGDRVWAIVESSGLREVRAYSADGEFLRRLAYQKDEPQPRQLAASLWEEMIFLLDENDGEQRLRALVLGAGDAAAPVAEGAESRPAAVSAWKITYFKRVLRADSFDAIAGHLGREKPLKAGAVSKIQLRANPLAGDEGNEVPVNAIVEPAGAVLQTADGLPLAGLTATPNLKWAVLVAEGPGLRVFQSDGSVVEEFKIANPENMMAFDAGEFELKPPGAKPAKPKTGADPVPKRNKPLRPGDDL